MSLLRRIDRDLPPDDEEEDDDAPQNRPPRPPQPESPIRELWHHRATHKLLSAVITRDNRFLVVGGLGGEVLFFDLAGRLLWTGQAEGGVNRIALAEDADCFLTGTLGSGKNAYLWHYSGRLLHTFHTGGSPWGIAITPDASLIAVGSLDKHLYLFDQNGQLIIKRPVQSPIRHVSLTSDGDYLFVSTEDHRVCAFDRHGGERWTYATEGSVWAGTRIAEQAHCLVAGSNDGYIYGLDFGGNEVWRFDTGGAVNNLEVTPDGSVCAVVGKANAAYLLNSQGNVLWEYQTEEPIYGLSLSHDGRYLLMGANDDTLYLVDREQNHRVWQQRLGGHVYGAALTAGGRFFAAASADHQTYVFHNRSVHDHSPELLGPDNKLLTRWIVRQVRDDYAVSPHMGLVRWFSEFERSLRNNQFDVCQALLNEAHEENSLGLSEGEQQYTRSLEGTYWLFRGIAYHRIEHYAEARECYEKSKALHESTHNQDGVGQVLAALSSLPVFSEDSTEEPAEDTPLEAPGDGIQIDLQKLLDEIIAKPRVLGTSEKVLEYRLDQVSPSEQFQIVLLAKQAGYISPLVLALSAQERVVRAAASAALTLLQPGPDDGVLEKMLTSTQSFVRWQALRILRHRAHTNPRGFATTKERLWIAVVPAEPFTQTDTLVRREEALLAKEAGEESDTPWLLARLNDPDPDVQIAAIEALGAVGDRRALPELARVPNRIGFLGVNTKLAAEEATAAVQKRYPLPLLQKVHLGRENPWQQRTVQQSSLILTDAEAVYAIVTVDHVQPGTLIKAKWLHRSTTLREETSEITEEPGPMIAEVRETTIIPEGPVSRFGIPRPPAPDEDERRDERPGRLPFGQRPAPEPPPRPPARSPYGDRSQSPFGRRDSDAPPRSPYGGDRPRSPFDRTPDDAPRPPIFGGRPGSTPDPNENIEPAASSPFPPRPGSAPPAPPQDDDDDFDFIRDRLPLRRPPARERPPVPPEPSEPNLLRRVWAERQSPPPPPPRPTFGGFRPAARPGSAAPGARPGSAAPLGRPRPGDTPPWLARMRGEPSRERPGAPRPGTPARSPFSRETAQSTQDRPQPARPGFLSSPPVSRRSPTARRVVFSLPRPEDGWQAEAYQIEITINGENKNRTEFRLIDAITLTGLEPGLAGSSAEKDFGKTHVFLSNSRFIDCLVHAKDAPVNTLVTGRLYNTATGALLGESTAFTQKQGRQAVQLSWENPGWRTGHYRIVVSVTPGNELTTEIELLNQLQIDHIALCHEIDNQNGPIGTDWPFYSGDSCYCVLELEAPPPGVEIQALWYRKGQVVSSAEPLPYITSPGGDQRAVFNLPAEHARLRPGHYSVVIRGSHVTRKERSFEVLTDPPLRRLKRAAEMAIEKVTPSIHKYHLLTGLGAASAIFLLALALILLDAGVERILDSGALTRDAMLSLGHAAGHPTPLWGLGWLAFAAGYGVFYTRSVQDSASTAEKKAYVPANLLLVFTISTLTWYQLGYIALGTGRLWPGAWWGFFKSLNWLTPGFVWLAPLAGAALTGWLQREDEKQPFYWAFVNSALVLLVLAFTCYAGAFAAGFTLGLMGAAAGGLLDLSGMDNNWGRVFFSFGTNLGFIAAPIVAALYYYRQTIQAWWKDWREESSARYAKTVTLLDYLLNKSKIPLKAQERRALAALCLYLLAAGGLAVIVWAAVFDPVAIPILKWLYNTQDSHALSSPHLTPVLALGLLTIWPGLVYGFHTRILTPGLDADEEETARHFSTAAALAAGLALIVIAWLSRTPIGREYTADLSVFWVNRIAVLSLLALLIGYTAILNRTFADWLSQLSAGKLAAGLATLLAAALLPIWMWAILLAIAFVIVGIGIPVLNEIL